MRIIVSSLLLASLAACTVDVAADDQAIISPDLVAAPAALDFGSVAIGGKATLQLTLTNAGTTDIQCDMLGDTATLQYSKKWIAQLAPGESFTTLVTFQPLEVGTMDAEVYVYDGQTAWFAVPAHGKGY